MVAEKPSIARSVSDFLSNGGAYRKNRGKGPGTPVYQWRGG